MTPRVFGEAQRRRLDDALPQTRTCGRSCDASPCDPPAVALDNKTCQPFSGMDRVAEGGKSSPAGPPSNPQNAQLTGAKPRARGLPSAQCGGRCRNAVGGRGGLAVMDRPMQLR